MHQEALDGLAQHLQLQPRESKHIDALPQLSIHSGESTPKNKNEVNHKSDSQGEEYTVRPGDNLTKIAEKELDKNGHHASEKEKKDYVNRIIEANKDEHPELLSSPDKIKPGEKLRLPAPGNNHETTPSDPSDQIKPNKPNTSPGPNGTQMV